MKPVQNDREGCGAPDKDETDIFSAEAIADISVAEDEACEKIAADVDDSESILKEHNPIKIPAKLMFAADEIEDHEIIVLRNTIIRQLMFLEDQ